MNNNRGVFSGVKIRQHMPLATVLSDVKNMENNNKDKIQLVYRRLYQSLRKIRPHGELLQPTASANQLRYRTNPKSNEMDFSRGNAYVPVKWIAEVVFVTIRY
jgi:hypothetical protein